SAGSRARSTSACGEIPSRRCRWSCRHAARRRPRPRSCACRARWACRSLLEVGVALLDERVARLVGNAGEVELEREALLEAVRALHVPQVDAVERLLGSPDHGAALAGDLAGD